MRQRDNNPNHPRSASSGRLSAEEFRSLMGRGFEQKRAQRHISSFKNPILNQPTSALPFEVTLPFLPPSVNGTFVSVIDSATGKQKRVLSTKARKARKAIQQFVHGRLNNASIYELHVTVELPAVTSDGGIRKVDLTNRIKFLEDCVAACLGIDDSRFFRVVLTKLHAEHERTVIRILPFQQTASDAA